MSQRTTRLVVFLAMVVATSSLQSAAPGFAEESPCYSCHDEQVDLETVKPWAWRFDWTNFSEGLHADLECDDCHVASTDDGFEDLPHEINDAETPTCSDCHGGAHEQIDAEFELSIHSRAGDGIFQCWYCHDPHAPSDPETDLSVREHVRVANNPCLDCHESAERYTAAGGGPGALPDLHVSHRWLPRKGRHVRIILCVCCHTPLDHPGIHEILAGSQAVRLCESCHRQNSPVAAKFLGEPDRTTWITNDILYSDAYVKGAMRHRLVDAILLSITALAMMAALIHGAALAIARRRRQDHTKMETEYVYDGWVRSWHWVNALLFVILLITGFRIHFGGREEPILSFETAFHTHNFVGAAIVIWWVWFILMGIFTGNASSYWRAPESRLTGMVRQVRYYLTGIFKNAPHPFHPAKNSRFNPLQQMTYLTAMFLLFPILVVTGIMLLYPEWLPDTIAGRNSGWVIATIHYLTGFFLAIFLVIHLYLCTLGDRVSYIFRGMIDGLHRRDVKDETSERESPAITLNVPQTDRKADL